MPRTGPPTSPLPDVFVVGDAKCGTTSLHRLFELAPAIGTPRTRKELHWFSAPELVTATAGPGDAAIPGAIIHTEADYLSEFAHLSPDLPAIADVSPSYLRNPEAARRLHAFARAHDLDARIVILLREPAAKVFSQYVHLWTEGRETLPFEEALAASAARRAAGFSDMFDYEGGGIYAEHVARYLDLFGPDRVRVVLFEDMVRDMAPVRAGLEAFLGVGLPATGLPQTNVGGRPKSPLVAALLGNERLKATLRRTLPLGLRTRIASRVRQTMTLDKPELGTETRAALRHRYAADVAELETMLGRATGWLPA